MRAIAVRKSSSWSGMPADRVVLDYDDRHRRRLAMTAMQGLDFLLDLPAASRLNGGDALVLEDGRLVEIIAAAEPLLEIRCKNSKHLTRIAWHLGNRHLPAQILANALRIRRDHVIAAMAELLGAEVVEIDAPFDPEAGAYAASSVHDHGGNEHHGG